LSSPRSRNCTPRRSASAEVLSDDKQRALDGVASFLVIAAADFLPVITGDEVKDAALQVEGGVQERVPVPAHDLLQAGRLVRPFAAFLELTLEASLENGRRTGRLGAERSAEQRYDGRDHGHGDLDAHGEIMPPMS
jgi:hypothetical protein